MFNSKIMTKADLKEAAKRNRVRQIEEERRPRIFNVKQRMIGLDVAALDQQREERRERRAALRQEDHEYLELRRLEEKYLKETEQRLACDKQRLRTDTLRFWRESQRKEWRREWDLNDPQALRKEPPALLADDPRLTVSSMQRFEGEQGAAEERQRVQREQQRAWLLQQMADRRKDRETKAKLEAQLRDTNTELDRRVAQLDRLEELCRVDTAKAVIEFNLLLAKERAARAKAEDAKQKEDVLMHLSNVINSEFLTENSLGTPSNLAVGKIVGATYRGMSEAEQQALKEVQQRQIAELRARRKEEELRAKDWLQLWDEQDLRHAEAAGLQERARKQRQRALLEENLRLAREQRAHRDYLEQAVYKAPGPSAAFYLQFNKTTR